MAFASEYKKNPYDNIVDRFQDMHYFEQSPEGSSSEEEFQFGLTDTMEKRQQEIVTNRKDRVANQTTLDKIIEHGGQFRNVGFCKLASKFPVGRDESRKFLQAE